jgi:hypothetical protein
MNPLLCVVLRSAFISSIGLISFLLLSACSSKISGDQCGGCASGQMCGADHLCHALCDSEVDCSSCQTCIEGQCMTREYCGNDGDRGNDSAGNDGGPLLHAAPGAINIKQSASPNFKLRGAIVPVSGRSQSARFHLDPPLQ